MLDRHYFHLNFQVLLLLSVLTSPCPTPLSTVQLWPPYSQPRHPSDRRHRPMTNLKRPGSCLEVGTVENDIMPNSIPKSLESARACRQTSLWQTIRCSCCPLLGWISHGTRERVRVEVQLCWIKRNSSRGFNLKGGYKFDEGEGVGWKGLCHASSERGGGRNCDIWALKWSIMVASSNILDGFWWTILPLFYYDFLAAFGIWQSYCTIGLLIR